MILNKPCKTGLAQVRIEVAKRLREEIRSAVLKCGEIAKDEQPLRAVRHMRSQRNMVSSSTELEEVLTELKRNGIRKFGMSLETPVVS